MLHHQRHLCAYMQRVNNLQCSSICVCVCVCVCNKRCVCMCKKRLCVHTCENKSFTALSTISAAHVHVLQGLLRACSPVPFSVHVSQGLLSACSPVPFSHVCQCKQRRKGAALVASVPAIGQPGMGQHKRKEAAQAESTGSRKRSQFGTGNLKKKV